MPPQRSCCGGPSLGEVFPISAQTGTTAYYTSGYPGLLFLLFTTLRRPLARFCYCLLPFGAPWPVFATICCTLAAPGPLWHLFTTLGRFLARFCYYLLPFGNSPSQKKWNFAQSKWELSIEAKKGTSHQRKKGNHSAWPGLLLGLTCRHDLIGSPGQLCSAVLFESILEKGVKVSKRRVRNSMRTFTGDLSTTPSNANDPRRSEWIFAAAPSSIFP